MDLWKGIAWSERMRIAWLLFWRVCLIYFGIGLVVGFVGGLLRVPQPIYCGLSAILGMTIAWPVVVSQMLRKKFNGFGIAIIRDRASSAT